MAGTEVYGRLVELGIQVLTEVVLVLDAPLAVGAVCVRIMVMFLELFMVVEILSVIRFVCNVC